MTRGIFLAHLVTPALFMLVIALFAGGGRGRSMPLAEVLAIAAMLFLTFAAPHLWWAGFAIMARPRRTFIHAGFAASTLALLLIASLWLLPPDRSGLPIQWLLYWPLALILQIVIGGALCEISPKPETCIELEIAE